MKFNMKKSISTMLAMCLCVTALAGCGSSDSSNSASSGGDSAEKVTNVSFPLESAKEYTFHYHARDKYVFDPTWPVYVEMAELTNITFVNTASPVATNSTEQIQLQAIDRFPSDLYGANNAGPYFMQYGPDGAFYPLNEYWELLPNFRAYLDENPDVEASITAEDGNIYHIPYIQDGGVARTYHIRTDWLDNLGLAIPETVQDLEKVLIAFRDDDPNGNGEKDEIPYFNDKWNEMIRLVNLWDSRCYANDTYAERVIPGDDGQMYHAWMTDEFRDAIINVSRWYDEGLIDKEIFTKGSSSRKEYIPGDIGGVTHEWVASTSSYNDIVTDIAGFSLETFAPPISDAGNQWEEHQRLKVKPDGWAVSANCDSPSELFAFMDYFYSEEGRILSNFGVEGQQWNYVDGVPTFTDEVLNGEKAVNAYLEEEVGAQLKHGYWMDYEYERQWTNAQGQEGVDLYTEGKYSEGLAQIPTLAYTEAEKVVYDKYLTAINDYQDEMIQKWVIEDHTKIADQWDTYLKQLETRGVNELLANYQQAYDRYMEIAGR